MNHLVVARDVVVVTPRGSAAISPFTVNRGDVVLVVGPIGSGKSALLHGLVKRKGHLRGSLTTVANDRAPAPFRRGWSNGVALVAQHHLVFADLTVEENIRVGWEMGRRATLWSRSLAACCEVSDTLGPLLRRRADTLSGGERRMVAIMRAYAADPTLVLLDEPLTGLDASRRRWICDLITSWRRRGTAFIIALQQGDDLPVDAGYKIDLSSR